ncbi:MAG: alpha/beta fold hydrolase, partial [Actinomycetota bacterium]
MRSAPPATLKPPVVVPTGPVAWRSCGGGFQCGTLQVPLDYEHPERGRIGIALKRYPARDPARRIGSLLYNPGGPGTSGVGAVAGQVNRSTAGILDRFDVVGFDPRGVGQSSAVRCDAAPSLPDPIPDPVPPDDATRQAVIAANNEYAADCVKYSNGVLPHVGSDNVARDMDQLRIALGDERLTYLGQSYGTFLGQVYAELFPGRIRALALDGVIDPALTTEEFANAAAEGFDRQLLAFGGWCQATP